MFHQDALGQFQFQRSRIQACFIQDCEDAFKKVLIPKLDSRNIHRHRSHPQARIDPCLALPAGFAKHPLSDRQDEAAILRNRNEV